MDSRNVQQVGGLPAQQAMRMGSSAPLCRGDWTLVAGLESRLRGDDSFARRQVVISSEGRRRNASHFVILALKPLMVLLATRVPVAVWVYPNNVCEIIMDLDHASCFGSCEQQNVKAFVVAFFEFLLFKMQPRSFDIWKLVVGHGFVKFCFFRFGGQHFGFCFNFGAMC